MCLQGSECRENSDWSLQRTEDTVCSKLTVCVTAHGGRLLGLTKAAGLLTVSAGSRSSVQRVFVTWPGCTVDKFGFEQGSSPLSQPAQSGRKLDLQTLRTRAPESLVVEKDDVAAALADQSPVG